MRSLDLLCLNQFHSYMNLMFLSSFLLNVLRYIKCTCATCFRINILNSWSYPHSMLESWFQVFEWFKSSNFVFVWIPCLANLWSKLCDTFCGTPLLLCLWTMMKWMSMDVKCFLLTYKVFDCILLLLLWSLIDIYLSIQHGGRKGATVL